jgi:heme O synthase-like polyprenyltransferase
MTFFVPTELFLNKPIALDYADYVYTLISTVGSMLLLFYVLKYYNRIDIEKPKWKSNPFYYKNPLTIFQFLAVCLVFFGLFLSIQNYLRTEQFNTISTIIIFFGLGIELGNHLAFFIDNKINQR